MVEDFMEHSLQNNITDRGAEHNKKKTAKIWKTVVIRIVYEVQCDQAYYKLPVTSSKHFSITGVYRYRENEAISCMSKS